jgi:hypothetical protein
MGAKAIKIQQEYEKDFYAWALHNAELIRQGKFGEVDIKHVAGEIESMGKSERRKLINRLAVLIAHLLKWQFQLIRRSKSWMITIKNQRFEINDLLKESPSLRHEFQQRLSHAYEKAILIASEQTAIEEQGFPKHCPFSFAQCLNFDFLPNHE